MPALFFPNLNALRIALASGLVPPEISQAPAEAGFDALGRLWLEPTEGLPREALGALARVGVQALGEIGIPTTPVACWAELLPLQQVAEQPRGPVLFIVPEKQVARFVARLRRITRAPVGVRLPDLGSHDHGWVTASRPATELLIEARDDASLIEAFTEQAPGVWVRHGWQHAVPEQLAIPEGCVLLLRPPRSVVWVPCEVPRPDPDEFALRPLGRKRGDHPLSMPPISVRLRLVPHVPPAQESLWILDARHEAEFWSACAQADAGMTAKLEAGIVGSGSETRLVVRTVGKRTTSLLPFAIEGFAPDPRVPGLFVPADRVLRPILRVRELAQTLGLRPGTIVWLQASPDGNVIPHAVPESAFQPVSELLEYQAPRAAPLQVVPRFDLFPLARFMVVNDLPPVPEPESSPQLNELEPIAPLLEPEPHANEMGWFRRSLRKLVSKIRPRDSENPERLHPERTQPRPIPVGPRVEQKLASPDALVHGHDWTARRRELEAQLFRDLPNLGPTGRAERWAELAGVYSATGNATDAAVCWMNAVWESNAPPVNWLEQWLTAESRAAKLPDNAGGLERWLSEPGRPGVGRVIAAYTAACGLTSYTPDDFLASLPRLLSFLDQHFDDVPVRAVWLARFAAARVCDGDALGLARWRDRVLARLTERGPGLDLDEPSFLRFHGTASAERFQAAREWFIRVREPALNWVQEHGLQNDRLPKPSGGKLCWVGLDCETTCTAAYAQFMLAWGMACLGERTRAKELAAKARKTVSHASGARVDPAAHAVLGDLFLMRVRDAQEGRPPKPGLPAELQARLDALPEFARYAVNRLREHSRILEPVDRIRGFQFLDLRAFWGNDVLGERLFALATSPARERVSEEAAALLDLCEASPTTGTIPRVVSALLEIAPWLDRSTLPRVLDHLPTAVEWTETWFTAGREAGNDSALRLLHHQSRLLGNGFTAAAMLDPSAANVLTELVRRLVTAGDRLRAPLLAASGQAFRVLRRFGLSGTAESLVRFLDPGQSGVRGEAARIGLAAGWFTAGNEDAGYRILDETRDALFLNASSNARQRTPMALAYAEALGFAPAGIAHGRLEEIFQQLGPLTGAANSYFTLQPLQLMDAIVRSVVTDEFSLGSSVRGWLDDDEFLIRSRIHRDLAAVLSEQDLA